MKKLSFEEINKTRCLSSEELKKVKRNPITAVCENIRSLYNVGSIFRTVDGIRGEKLYLCGFTGRPPRKEIDRVALGSVESVPWEYERDTIKVINYLKGNGLTIIAVEHTDSSVDFQRFKYTFPLAIVLGNEIKGISDEVLSHCDYSVEIPMYGFKQSLNVATACGVVAYEILRQYRANHRFAPTLDR